MSNLEKIVQLRTRANRLDADAMVELAEAYEQGIYGIEDLVEAKTLFVRAAEIGSVVAMRHLAETCLDKGDMDGWIEWLRRAMEAGCDESALRVANHLSTESDVKPIPARGSIQIRNAQEAGDIYEPAFAR